VLPPFVAIAVRPRPGVWEYVRVNVHELSVEQLTVSEYLRFKEELVDGQYALLPCSCTLLSFFVAFVFRGNFGGWVQDVILFRGLGSSGCAGFGFSASHDCLLDSLSLQKVNISGMVDWLCAGNCLIGKRC
jgi:hypothetical protein